MENKSILALGVVALLGASSAQAAIVTHYDIDFSSPTHSVGSAPTTDSGSNTPSSVVFGQPVVGNSLGALTDQPLVFNTTGNGGCCSYDQIRLDVGAGYDNYQLSFNMSSENFVNTGANNRFTLLFDTPEVRNVYFGNGDISIFQPSISSTIGSFADGDLVSMLIDIDLVTNTWDIFQNGSLLHNGFFDTSGGDIESIRFSYGSTSSTNFDSVGLDDILLTSQVATVPEPSVWMLMGLGLLGLMRLNKAKRSSLS